MSLKLVTDSQNPQTWKVLIAAKYGNVTIETVTGKVDESKYPFGKTPVLETAEGSLFEANAITRYVARLGKGSLYGNSVFEAGQIENYLDFATNDIELPGAVWVFPILGLIPANNAATAKAKSDVRKALEYLNKQLLTKTFLVGERITIADIVVAMSLYYLYQRVLDAGFRKQFVNVNRWYLTVVNQPEVKAVIGEVKLADKMEVAVETAAPAAKKEEPKKEAAPKPAAKPAAKKETEEEPEEDYEAAEKGEKKPNPLDSLPASKLNMDEWKRTYSNAKDVRKDAFPWFWEKFDKEGYSLYTCEYKYNHECEKVFMTANLIGGFFQRLDKLRKYGFGSLLIFGAEPKLEIAGAWLFRGTDIPQEMKEVDDFEHYEWTKLSADSEADRKLVEDFWAWDGNFNRPEGRPVKQGKTFK